MYLRLGSPAQTYLLLGIALLVAIIPFAGVLGGLYDIWNLKPEYSHGIIIPALSAYLIWRRRDELRGLPFTGSWFGVLLIVGGLALRFLGQQTTMHTLEHYAFLLVLYGLVLALTGAAIFRRLWMPLFILIFALPLPSFVDNNVSLQLQLLSSAIGVGIVRLAGISVLLEGNIIDLGNYQLEVAEACSGLRYLLPLMTLAFIVAYLFRGPLWKRSVIFLSSVPITILMNSLRIGFIAITVEHWGTEMAQGALHDFEGWLVFMFSTAALLLTAMALARIGASRVKWSQAFDLNPAANENARRSAVAPGAQAVPHSFVAAAVVALTGAALGLATPAAAVSYPARMAFEDFPAQIGGWTGQREALEPVYLDALRLDDYVMTNYRSQGGVPINFYSAYYRTQDATRAVHSPHDCIPGGGWQIQKLEQRSFPAVGTQRPFPMMRAVIQFGPSRQIVYYWFQERGRHMTNEYVVRWYLFWDALTRHRTDGGLVRFVAPFPQGVSEQDVDARIVNLATRIVPTLGRYIPD